ncbi:hypothetical protein AURDEDRAFT_113355 [Auricularia subglabra TFB-10046 SS5]|nr:hypothetical protein AURDEDRAFT_113355 [Auricularia subglabra TFB-10046 SS5]
MSCFATIASRLCGGDKNDYRVTDDTSDKVDAYVETLLAAEKPGTTLQAQLAAIVDPDAPGVSWDWKERFAKAVLAGLEDAVRTGKAVNATVSRAAEEAAEWAQAHPVYATMIALGVLVLLSPWIIEVLGFGELGPIEGTFAAAWQRQFAGYVPKGSLFSFFQRLGMVWRRYPKI